MKLRNSSLLLCLLLVGILFGQCTSSNRDQEKIHIQLKSEIEDINKQCPVDLSQFIRLDSCALEPNNDFINYYTIIDSAGYTLEQFKNLETETKYTAKNDPSMAVIRGYGISMQYIYRDLKGNDVFSFEITPQDYK